MTFKAGKSGNENGRPKGTGYRQQIFNILVESHREELFSCALKLALSGNENMLRLFLERMLPPKPKSDAISFSLSVESLVEKSSVLMQKLSEGEINVSDAETLMRTIYMESKIYEADELKKQVDELMRRAGKE
jgi:hypothetical protein